MVGKAWQQEHEAAGHIVATVRRQTETFLCWCSAYFSFLFSQRPELVGGFYPQSGWVFLY